MSYSQFIKLTPHIIHKNLISSINIKQNKYIIYILEYNINGIILHGSGGIISRPEKFEVCEKENPIDYKIISNWIDSI